MAIAAPTGMVRRGLRHLCLRAVLVGITCATLVLSWPAHAAVGAGNGHTLYLRHCASCHGPTGRGDGPDAGLFVAPPRDLHDGVLTTYSTDDLVRRVRSGRPLELALDLRALRARAEETEDIVAHLKRLSSVAWKTVDAGWALYVIRCVECHGEFGKPSAPPPPGVRAPRDLADPSFQQSMSDRELIAAVRHGRRRMPALTPRVPEREGPPLAAFVRLLSPGFQMYSRYCANCHGDDGQGGTVLGDSGDHPMVPFDREYFARRSPDEIRQQVWHMVGEHKPAMPHFRSRLSDDQARAVIQYLKEKQ